MDTLFLSKTDLFRGIPPEDIESMLGTYVIDVHSPQDAVYALMLVLAIDAEKCSRKD